MNTFLTIFTRCCNRPNALSRNIESVNMQSCNDIEQLFVIDRLQRGMKFANQQFYNQRHLPQGEYVFHLDDDGRFYNAGFVAALKKCAEQNNYPDVILCRQIQSKPTWRYLPPPEIWSLDWKNGERPERWVGSGYCYAVKTEIWRPNTIHYFPQKHERWTTGGDWHFMTALLELGVTVAQTEAISAIGSRSGGKFEQTWSGWFGTIANRYNLEKIERDVWLKKYMK